MGMLVTLEMLCQVHQIQQGSIELGLDGEGAYKAVFESTHTPADAKSYDLIRAIRGMIQDLPIRITGRHVVGHQDDRLGAAAVLDRWARLNIDMGNNAKARLRQIRNGPPALNVHMPHERVQVHFQGHKLARICKKALHQEIYGATSNCSASLRNSWTQPAVF